MASRRMKMKVSVNITGRSNPGRTTPGPPPQVSSVVDIVPATPDTCSPVAAFIPVISNSVCPNENLLSPYKPDSCDGSKEPILPLSPVRKSTHIPQSTCVPETTPHLDQQDALSQEIDLNTALYEADESHIFAEEEVTGLELVPVDYYSSLQQDRPNHGNTSRPSSPQKMTGFKADKYTRAPGIGPVVNSSSTNTILGNIQKEIGSVHMSHVTSNETLRQRLQKGTSSTTTKYSMLRKEFLAANKEHKPESKELTILHFTFWNPPSTNEIDGEENDIFERIDTTTSTHVEELPTIPNPPKNAEPTEDVTPTGPRVKVGPDGELIIDEKSLVVETSESIRAKKQLSEMETVMAVNSGFYRHKRTSRRGYDWNVKETVRFYKALTMCGTDFSMMAHLFPNRSRAELKAKFKREDRQNLDLMNRALSSQVFDPMEPITESEESDTERRTPSKRRNSSNKQSTNGVSKRTKTLKGTSRKRKNGKRRIGGVPIEQIKHDPSVGFVSADHEIHYPGPSRKSAKFNRKSKAKDELYKPTKPKLKMGRPVDLTHIGKTTFTFIKKSIQNDLKLLSQKEESKGKLEQKKRKSNSQKAEKIKLKIINEQSEKIALDGIDPKVLHFDASDPLGFKLIEDGESAASRLVRKLSSDERSSTENEVSLKSVDGSEDIQNEIDVDTSNTGVTKPTPSDHTPDAKRSRRSRNVKPKLPTAPRKPLANSAVTSSSLITSTTQHQIQDGNDEIEIEISCA